MTNTEKKQLGISKVDNANLVASKLPIKKNKPEFESRAKKKKKQVAGHCTFDKTAQA